MHIYLVCKEKEVICFMQKDDSKIYQSNKIEDSIKSKADSLINEVGLNAIVARALVSDVAFGLASDYYDIESTNTTESRVQATTATLSNTPVGVFAVQKISPESTIETVITGGKLLLSIPYSNEKGQKVIATITLKDKLAK